jgi:post-segregation antitoxin (ccd killing protein)
MLQERLMGQMSIYLDDALEQTVRARAAETGVSISAYISEAVEAKAKAQWPKSFIDALGSIPDFPTAEELRAHYPPDPKRAWEK